MNKDATKQKSANYKSQQIVSIIKMNQRSLSSVRSPFLVHALDSVCLSFAILISDIVENKYPLMGTFSK